MRPNFENTPYNHATPPPVKGYRDTAGESRLPSRSPCAWGAWELWFTPAPLLLHLGRIGLTRLFFGALGFVFLDFKLLNFCHRFLHIQLSPFQRPFLCGNGVLSGPGCDDSPLLGEIIRRLSLFRINSFLIGNRCIGINFEFCKDFGMKFFYV